jgi:hypothetical protein
MNPCGTPAQTATGFSAAAAMRRLFPHRRRMPALRRMAYADVWLFLLSAIVE